MYFIHPGNAYITSVSSYQVSHVSSTVKPLMAQIKCSSQWRHNGRDAVSNHLPHDCLLNRLFRRKSKKTSKLHLTGLCEGNTSVTGEFPGQKASSAENFSIWWCHHATEIISSYGSSRKPPWVKRNWNFQCYAYDYTSLIWVIGF